MSDQHDLSEGQKPREPNDPMSRLFRPEALDVGSPALVQHFAYRIHDDYAVRPDEWPESIQKLLDSLDDRLTKSAIKDHIADYKPNLVRIDEDENRRYRTALIDFSWRSIPIKMSSEIYPEYLAVTTVMDLSEWKADPNDPTAKELSENIIDLDRLLRARNAKINGQPVEQDVDWDALETKLHKALFTDLWDGTGTKGMDARKGFFDEIMKKPLVSGVELGERFTAGRGLVVSLADKGSENFILLPGRGIKPDLDKPNRLFKKIEGVREDISCANTVLSFIRAEPGMKEVAHSVSNLEGNCLYITAHGAQPQQPKPKNDPIATFFFLATHPEPSQLGYLVDRICILATVRRAGLFDYLQLMKASKALRSLESKLEEIGEQLAGKPAASGEAATLQSIPAELSAAYDKLNKAAAGEGVNRIPRGLLYRVDRSDTYLRYFDRLAGDLQIETVGSFRSYLELARRRLGDIYGAIASIGVRFETLTKKIDGVARQLQARELATQVNVIADLQTHMEKQTEVSTKYQGDIRTFLEFAENLAFFVFIPAALSDAAWKFIGEEAWKETSPGLKLGVFGASLFISRCLWDVMKTVKPREGEPDSYIRQGWNRIKKIATEKVIPKLRGCVERDFGRCAKDVIIYRAPQDRQRRWRVAKVFVKKKVPLKLRVHMKITREIREKRLSEGPYFG